MMTDRKLGRYMHTNIHAYIHRHTHMCIHQYIDTWIDRFIKFHLSLKFCKCMTSLLSLSKFICAHVWWASPIVCSSRGTQPA